MFDCPECGDDVSPPRDRDFVYDGELLVCGGCGLIWAVTCDDIDEPSASLSDFMYGYVSRPATKPLTWPEWVDIGGSG